MLIEINNNHNVDNKFENLFFLFDLMFVVVLIEQLNDNHYLYIMKEVHWLLH